MLVNENKYVYHSLFCLLSGPAQFYAEKSYKTKKSENIFLNIKMRSKLLMQRKYPL